MTPNLLIRPVKFCYKMGFPVQNNPKNLDPSYKMDLDIWDCFERKINPSYSQSNVVPVDPLEQYRLCTKV